MHLDIWEEGFQHVGAGVAGVEEHQLRLLQMARGETLLDVHILTLRQKTSQQLNTAGSIQSCAK